jgi:bifunctional enzyme CysN/CysC
MSHQSELIANDIHAYLEQHERKEILRFLTCGSVDDGKSTLIGRLLHDSKLIYEDQLEAVRQDSLKVGTQGDDVDLALVVDGLQAEREQGITIDVAYRYFSTNKRKFIIADTPGHEQYTRNMATGASTCDVAVILIDARNGVLTQTRRHSFIASLLGIHHVIVAINKMDLVDYSEEIYTRIHNEYSDFSSKLGIDDIHFIPISALEGDNVVDPSKNMPWYQGSTLMFLLENIHIASDRNFTDFRLPVQRVSRPDATFRGYAGSIESGVIQAGESVVVLPSMRQSRVKSIVTLDGELQEAYAPMAVTLTLDDEIDVSRGDMLVSADNLAKVQDRFEANVVWMSDEPMIPGKQYVIKHTTKQVFGQISSLRYQIDVNTLEHRPAPVLGLNEIGRCELALSQAIAFDAYGRNRSTGAFIVIDRISNITVGAGMIVDATAMESRARWDRRPSGELRPSYSRVTDGERAQRLGQRPVTLLFTGISGSGKSTIAYAVERELFDMGRLATVIDGQNLRLGVSRDLGFSAEERAENLRRSAEIAKLMNDSGMICLCAIVAPHESTRDRAREAVGDDNYLEIFVTAPIEVCRERDTSGLYEAAERGEIPSFPGVSSEFEAPENPDLVLETDKLSVGDSVAQVLALLRERHFID